MVSFIIPTLNEEKVLEALIKNLREIKTFPYEIIVSDGGSTDRTVEIANKFADKVVEHTGEKRQTIGEGRNAGAKQANGDFFVFLDADVYINEPDIFFARALKHFENDDQLVGLNGFLRVFKEAETWGDIIGYRIFSNGALFLYNNILKNGAGCGEFGIMKRSVFNSIKGYREDLAVDEDQDLFRRLCKIGKTKTDPKLVVYHTGRRPHAIGWPKLLWRWSKNWLALIFFNRSADKEWEVIR